MVSPRRSSRARSTAVTASHSQSSHSSASSSRSRHIRNRTEDADPEPSSAAEPDAQNGESTGDNDMADDANDDSGSQGDEITRCVCGYQEYQGGDDDGIDTDGLFIQCDTCSVWQHCPCVGLPDFDSTPDNYYCELCKPELHKIGHNVSGMKTSVYLAVRIEERKQSISKEENKKRRTTMNSRDAEYDDEVFKRMLEISKHETKPTESTRGSRGRKRGTSEGSEETVKETKRPRTSGSPDEQSKAVVESEDERPLKAPPAPSSTKKSRSNGTRSSAAAIPITNGKRTSARNRQVEKVEPKKDESEHSDDYAPRKTGRTTGRSTAAAAVTTPTIKEPTPPAPEPAPDTPQQTSKRAARNNNNNNNNTTSSGNSSSNNSNSNTTAPVTAATAATSNITSTPTAPPPAPSSRRRTNNRHTAAPPRHSEEPPMAPSPSAMSRTHSSTGTTTAILEKPTKPRLPAARMSLNEMKKRVNGISEYITRTQVEMANSRQNDIYAYLAWMEEKGTPTATPTPPDDSKNAVDIMASLSTKINHWQQKYGEVHV